MALIAPKGIRGKLTEATVAAARHNGTSKGPCRLTDARGLLLTIQPRTHAKAWILRIMRDGVRREIGLGKWPELSLDDARELGAMYLQRLAMEKVASNLTHLFAPATDSAPSGPADAHAIAQAVAAVLAGQGHGPALPVAAVAASVTVASVVDACIANQRPAWKDGRTMERKWRNTLTTYAGAIMAKPVGAVDKATVKRLLLPLWADKPAAANELRQRLHAVFALAVAEGHIAANPVDGIEAVLPKRIVKKAHHVAVHFEDAPAAFAAIGSYTNPRGKATAATTACLRFAILTASRSGEARGARWEEVDLAAATWTVPAERMKAKRPHVVSLSGPAVELLAAQGPKAAGLVFTAKQGGELTNPALTHLMARLALADREGQPATVHGFRSTFAEWAVSQGVDKAVYNGCLAHADRDQVHGAYMRGKGLAERQASLLAAWGAFLTS